ncbi:HipA domain-containing protein (plasmid) [Comamonas aquatica]|nr:HipA domain-containing protein [Comamonas aquatica]
MSTTMREAIEQIPVRPQQHLSVYHDEQLVGHIGYEPNNGNWTLQYAPEWAASRTSFPLSPTLPLNADPATYQSETIKRFVVNLFPEGRALEIAIETLKISRNNSFALLAEYGADTAGAFIFSNGVRAPVEVQAKRLLPREELSQRIAIHDKDGYAMFDGKVRMSVAGYQDKLVVYTQSPLTDLDVDTEMFLVDRPLASTAILKPEPKQLPFLVANEHFCMRLAKVCGLPVAEVALLRVPQPVLAVERFDRQRDKEGNAVWRLHTIDACQALDLPVEFKYERNLGRVRPEYRDGVSFSKLFSIEATTPTRLNLIRWAIFQLLIGNSDAHGKNFSYFVRRHGLEPTPWYDVVSVVQYEQFEHDLAMGVGDAFTWEEVSGYELATFARDCSIPMPTFAREVKSLVKSITKQSTNAKLLAVYTREERAIVERIIALAIKRGQRLIELSIQAKGLNPYLD